jgi:hypothetical protein
MFGSRLLAAQKVRHLQIQPALVGLQPNGTLRSADRSLSSSVLIACADHRTRISPTRLNYDGHNRFPAPDRFSNFKDGRAFALNFCRMYSLSQGSVTLLSLGFPSGSFNIPPHMRMQVWVHRARKYLGAYLVHLRGDVDAIVFSAGIGERSAVVRRLICEGLEGLGIEIDEAKNEAARKEGREIQSERSQIKVSVKSKLG